MPLFPDTQILHKKPGSWQLHVSGVRIGSSGLEGAGEADLGRGVLVPFFAGGDVVGPA